MRIASGARLALVLAVLLGARVASAQTGTIAGRVTEKGGAPIPGAEVRVDSTQIHSTTDGDGRYTLRDVPAGSRTVRALMLGYKSITHRCIQKRIEPVKFLDFALLRSVASYFIWFRYPIRANIDRPT